MGYSRNGQDFVTQLCEVGYGNSTTDRRGRADINTKPFWFGGGTRATNNPDEQFITYVSGFTYSQEALGGKYGGWPTFQRYEYQVSKKGYRPSSKHRYATSTTGSVFIKRATDGSIFVTNSITGTSGTTIIPAITGAQYCFVCMCGGGGGGGGATAVASGGGGGGAGYFYGLLRIYGFVAAWVGTSGAGGAAGNNNGSAGGNTRLAVYSSVTGYRNGEAPLDQVTCQAGESGYGGGNSSGGGGAGKGVTQPSGAYIRNVSSKAGASGGQRNNAGGNSTVNFQNYTPEAESVTYFTGGGGASGGSSGGGGGGGSPLGQGGAGGTKGGGGTGSLGSGGGGGGYKAFNTTAGGSGGPGYISIMY